MAVAVLGWAFNDIAAMVSGMNPNGNAWEISMSFALNASDIRELTVNELNDVAGAFKISAFGVTIEASAAHKGVAVTVEGVGGVSVTTHGVAVLDGKGDIHSAPWPH
jgi:hypothetical protein